MHRSLVALGLLAALTPASRARADGDAPPDVVGRIPVRFHATVGAVYVHDLADRPGGLTTDVGVAFVPSPYVHIGLSTHGAVLFESFGHAQPLARLCFDPAFVLPVDEVELRLGARGCVIGARHRDERQDRWYVGLSVGGFATFAFLVAPGWRVLANLEGSAWEPAVLYRDDEATPRLCGAWLGASAGVELAF
ncbi:MAG: hypothetical protein AB7P00_06360 [Sandaracinaceae bacterium]